jgi:hypothetical protein
VSRRASSCRPPAPLLLAVHAVSRPRRCQGIDVLRRRRRLRQVAAAAVAVGTMQQRLDLGACRLIACCSAYACRGLEALLHAGPAALPACSW